MTRSNRKQSLPQILLVVVLLLLYVFSRSYRVLALPPFLDESEQIDYARLAYSGYPLAGGGNARLLGGWWVGLFQDTGDPALWINRIATGLLSLLSAAAIYSAARRLASSFAGILAVILYILMPFALFHERLGLSDPYASVFGALTLWFAVRYVARGRAIDAVLCGLMVTCSILGKGTGIMLAAIPGIVFVLLIPVTKWHKIVRGLIAAYVALAVTWIPFYLYLRSIGDDYFSIPTTNVGTNNLAGVPNRLLENLRFWWATDSIYMSPLFVVAAIVLAIYLLVRRPRVGAAMTLLTIVPVVGLLAFGTSLSGRYLLFHAPILAAGLGIALSVLADDLCRFRRIPAPLTKMLPAALVAIWALIAALPFDVAMYSDPASQRLPDRDQHQYFTGNPSGYGVNQAASYVIQRQYSQQQPIHFIGMVFNCSGLRHMIPSATGIVVECPSLPYTVEKQELIATYLNQQAFKSNAEHYDLWFVYEKWPATTLDGFAVPYQAITSFYRPGNLSFVTLYHVLPNDSAGAAQSVAN